MKIEIVSLRLVDPKESGLRGFADIKLDTIVIKDHRDQWKYLESPSVTKVENMQELYNSLEEEPDPQAQGTPSAPGPMFDVAKYLGEHGIQLTIKSETQKTIFQLAQCFWADQHGGEKDGRGHSAIIQDTTGLITFHCFHAHCQGRTWRDVRELLSSKKEQKKPTSKEEIKVFWTALPTFEDVNEDAIDTWGIE
jgi:hypothetical protein